MVEKSINSANSQLKKIYNKSYDKILDIIEEEFDLEDIDEILGELAQPRKKDFIGEIKEQIILNSS